MKPGPRDLFKPIKRFTNLKTEGKVGLIKNRLGHVNSYIEGVVQESIVHV